MSARAAPSSTCAGLTKRFGERTVVDRFRHPACRAGAIYGFLGPNGSGKTTTIRMLCGLLTPDAGEGTCLGFDVRHEAARIKERVGYMTQKFSLLRGSDDPRESRFRRAHVRARSPRKQRVDASARGSRPGGSRQAARGLAVRRLEAAAGACRRACCTSRNCCCSMSRRPASIPRRGATSGTRSTGSRPSGVTVLVSTHYMDEAVQCDFITYIAYGKKLIDGRAGTIPEDGGALTTCRSRAATSRARRRGWRSEPGVEQVARFGAIAARVGTDDAALDATVETTRLVQGRTTLERCSGAGSKRPSST